MEQPNDRKIADVAGIYLYYMEEARPNSKSYITCTIKIQTLLCKVFPPDVKGLNFDVHSNYLQKSLFL